MLRLCLSSDCPKQLLVCLSVDFRWCVLLTWCTDQLTTNWIHFVLTVTPSKVAMYLDGIEQHQFCFFDPAPSPPPEDPYAVPPPPPPIPFGCPPPPPAPEPMPAQCTNFLECGQAYCPPPPAPGTPGGLDTLAPPPPPVDAQDSRLNIAYPNPEELYGSFNKFQLAGESHLGSSLPHSAGVADARGGGLRGRFCNCHCIEMLLWIADL